MMAKGKIPYETIQTWVAIFKTCDHKLQGKYEKKLVEVIDKSKKRFNKYAPAFDYFLDRCKEENNAALGTTIAEILNKGLESEELMVISIGNANELINEWIRITKIQKER